jgi:D-amino-acid dehydrogenase
MQSGKGYSLTLTHPVQLPQLCSILTEAKVAVTPMGNSLRFAGTMEIGGLNTDIDPARVRGIVKAATRYFPNFKINDFDGLKPWVGLRPVSPDGMPYLGKVPDLDNLVVATGHAMMGLSLAPVTGKLVTEILKNQPTSIPLKALAPNRFS